MNQPLKLIHPCGRTLVVAMHEYETARYWAEFVIVMAKGSVILTDKTEAVFSQLDVLESSGLNAP